jgi:hypothetical protein
VKSPITLSKFVVGLLAVAAVAGATGHQVYVNYGNGANAIAWWAHPTLTSMRCQMLYDQSYISYAGTITEFMLEKTDATSANFTNVKFYLCHTPCRISRPVFRAITAAILPGSWRASRATGSRRWGGRTRFPWPKPSGTITSTIFSWKLVGKHPNSRTRCVV